MAASLPHAPLTLAIGPVTVAFSWAHDRWSHRVTLRDGRTWQSIEGPPADGDPRWPASPVIVELSRLQTPRGDAVLGVGLAGRSHFSVCVGPDPHDPDRALFEIACRSNEPPVWLGSTYHGPAGPTTIAPPLAGLALPATIQWGYAFSGRGLVLLPCEPPRDRSDS
ncbi:MAG: hypothetical protein ACK48S_06655 [Planctomycetia bacterium]|jgi:hypothetical protein